MNQVTIVATLPLVFGILLYIFQALGYQFILHRPGMALAFFGYALANVGLLYDAFTTTNL